MQVVEEAPLILMVSVQAIKLQIPVLLNYLHMHLKNCQYHGDLLIPKREWDLFGEDIKIIDYYYYYLLRLWELFSDQLH